MGKVDSGKVEALAKLLVEIARLTEGGLISLETASELVQIVTGEIKQLFRDIIEEREKKRKAD